MVSTYVRMIAFQYAVLKGAIAQLKTDDEGMTTLEVLVIAAGLVALAASAVVVITKVAQGKVSNVETPTAALTS